MGLQPKFYDQKTIYFLVPILTESDIFFTDRSICINGKHCVIAIQKGAVASPHRPLQVLWVNIEIICTTYQTRAETASHVSPTAHCYRSFLVTSSHSDTGHWQQAITTRSASAIFVPLLNIKKYFEHKDNNYLRLPQNIYSNTN